jgi:hypothetical protein
MLNSRDFARMVENKETSQPPPDPRTIQQTKKQRKAKVVKDVSIATSTLDKLLKINLKKRKRKKLACLLVLLKLSKFTPINKYVLEHLYHIEQIAKKDAVENIKTRHLVENFSESKIFIFFPTASTKS